MRLRNVSHHPQGRQNSSQQPLKKAGLFSRFSVRRSGKTTKLLTLRPSRKYQPDRAKLSPYSVVIPRRAMNRNDADVVLTTATPRDDPESIMTGRFTSTVAHIIATPTEEAEKRGINGLWHVKFPAGVGKIEKLKRKLVAGFMRLRNKPYKARYFDNPKTLAEREVLAGKMAQLVSIRGPSYASKDWSLNKSVQIETLHNAGQLCVANRHIHNKYSASLERGRDIVYDGEHNPATVYAIRRFFLGDEDAVKRDNYLVNHNDGVHCFIPVDYGFAFYNHSEDAESMNFEEFSQWILQLPTAHKLHYALLKRGDSIMDLIHAMSPEDKTRAVYMALKKIASLKPNEPHLFCQHISDPGERDRIQQQLLRKISMAGRMVGEARHHPDIQPLL